MKLKALLERVTPLEDGTIIGRQGRPLKPKFNKANGYYSVNVSMGGGVVATAYVHRLVCAKFYGCFDDMTANHKDLDKANNHKDNLEWLTQADNTRHYLVSLGFDSDLYDDILACRGMYSNRAIARMFGISKNVVNRVLSE